MTPLAIIRDTLREQGRTQVWLAARIGVSDSMLSKYLHGTVPAPDWVIDKARVALGIPLSAFPTTCDAPNGATPAQTGADA